MAKRSVNVTANVPASKAVKHFDFSLQDDDFEEMSKGYRPKNMEASTSWALKMFQSWIKCRNAGNSKEKERCPSDLLATNDKAGISRWLA